MKTKLMLSVLVVAMLSIAGCVDSRTSRAASLCETKAKVAQVEMKAAVTDAEKVKIAEQYFDTNIPLLEAVNAYLQGVDPDAKAAANKPTSADTPATETK